jgi:hypothetical protein
MIARISLKGANQRRSGAAARGSGGIHRNHFRERDKGAIDGQNALECIFGAGDGLPSCAVEAFTTVPERPDPKPIQCGSRPGNPFFGGSIRPDRFPHR